MINQSWLIISGTTRKGSVTFKIATVYKQLLKSKGVNSHLLSLEDLPHECFSINKKSEYLVEIEKSILIPATKIVFIVPEYNGSFPGSLKLLMDCCDTRNVFWHKKAALVGLSDGRNGNLRGLDHLTGVLNYLKINVLHYKVTMPQVAKMMDENGNLADAHLLNTLEKQIAEFEIF